MIVDCPHCQAPNAAEAPPQEDPAVWTCRSCGQPFAAPQQAEAAGTHTTLVVQVGPAAAPDADTTRVSGPVVLTEEARTVGARQAPLHAAPRREAPAPAAAEVEAGRGQAGPSEDDNGERSLISLVADLRPRAQAGLERARTWWARQPQARQVRWLAAGALATVGLGALMAWALRGRAEPRAFCAVNQPLLVKPEAGAGRDAVALLPRGAEVAVFDTVGAYAMVRDLRGRVGYVGRQRLLAERPQSLPQLPFVDCFAAPLEATTEACEARAQAQWTSCGLGCRPLPNKESCGAECDIRYRACMATCLGEQPEAEPGTLAPRL